MKNYTLTFIIVCLSFLSVAQNPVFNWEMTKLSENNLKVMAIDGDTAVIAGYDNSFFKSTNGGTSWDTLNLIGPESDFYDISVKNNTGYLVSRASKLYDAKHDVYANGVLLKTANGGQTWTAIDAPVFLPENDETLSPDNTLCYAIDFQSVEIVNDTIAFCALRWYVYNDTGYDKHAGIFKTKDGGNTWQNISGDMSGDLTTCIVFSGETGFAAGSKHLFKLSASVDTVIDYFGNMNSNGKGFIYDISLVDENEVYLVTTADSIYYSMDGGTSFGKFPGLKGGLDISNINDSTIVVCGNTGKSYVSTDSGQSWQNLNLSTSIWEIAGIMDDSLHLLANSAIYKIGINDLLSGNYNYSIQALGNGNLQKAYIASQNEMTVIGFNGSFYRTTDGGLSWSPVTLPHIPELDRFYENIDFDGLSMNGNTGYASFNRFKFVDYDAGGPDDIYWPGGIIYTSDSWNTWNFLDISKIGKAYPDDPGMNPNHAACTAVNTGLLNYSDDNVLLLYCKWLDYSSGKTEHGRIFKTLDGGANWTVISEDLSNRIVNTIVSKGDTLYIGGNKTLLKTTNAELKTGNSILEFTNLYPMLDEGENDAMFVNAVWADNDELFVVTMTDSCFMSTDGGATFSSLGSVKGSFDFYRFDSNSMIILGPEGKSVFTNNTTDWIACYPGSTIFKIGGIYNNKLYGLAKGEIYSTGITALDISTYTPLIIARNELNVHYNSGSVEIISDNKEIERCILYSISGKIVSVQEPNNRICRFNTNQYQAGIYIVKSLVEGKAFSNKIIFK
ncbi:MAG: hypothetical protein ACK5M7_18190 [Draconibacterium sp.]